jgi:hypothetical protein
MAETLCSRLSQVFPRIAVNDEVGAWLAGKVLECDGSIISTMLINQNGGLIAQSGPCGPENDEFGLRSSTPIAFKASRTGIFVFLRLDSTGIGSRVREKVLRVLEPPSSQVTA